MTGWLLLVAVCMHAMHVPSLRSPPGSAIAGCCCCCLGDGGGDVSWLVEYTGLSRLGITNISLELKGRLTATG